VSTRSHRYVDTLCVLRSHPSDLAPTVWATVKKRLRTNGYEASSETSAVGDRRGTTFTRKRITDVLSFARTKKFAWSYLLASLTMADPDVTGVTLIVASYNAFPTFDRTDPATGQPRHMLAATILVQVRGKDMVAVMALADALARDFVENKEKWDLYKGADGYVLRGNVTTYALDLPRDPRAMTPSLISLFLSSFGAPGDSGSSEAHPWSATIPALSAMGVPPPDPVTAIPPKPRVLQWLGGRASIVLLTTLTTILGTVVAGLLLATVFGIGL
jgi:hypothetical protein